MFCFFLSLTPNSSDCHRQSSAVRWLARLTSLVGQGMSELKYDKKSLSLLKKKNRDCISGNPGLSALFLLNYNEL